MEKILGIIGGMGPLATSAFFEVIINLTDALYDQDHMRILIDNNTKIPDRTLFLTENAKDPFEVILSSALLLEKWGANYIVIPCNTAHYCYHNLQSKINIPILSIIDASIDVIKNDISLQDGLGVLGTRGLRSWGGYTSSLEKLKIPYFELDNEEQDKISFLIADIKNKGITEDNTLYFKTLLNKLKLKGWKHFILACTELALMEDAIGKSSDYINTIDNLAKKAILACGYKIKE